MDKITDFFKELRTRVSSPFFSSFIIAWFVINWKIPIALMFYKLQEVTKDGFSSYFDLIEKEINFNSGLIQPFIGALLYTFIYPIFRNLVLAANSWANKWGTDWSLKIAKRGAISVERYIRLRENYEKQIKITSEVLGSEADFKNKNDELTTVNLELSKERNNWAANYEELRKSSRVETYNGEWQISYLNEGKFVNENATISAGNISIPDSVGNYRNLCKIKLVTYSSETGEYIFLFQQENAEFFQIFRIKNADQGIIHSISEKRIIREMRRL